MPRTKKEIDAITKKIKANINSINAETGAGLSFAKIRADIERMFAMNAAERDAAIRAYEIAIRKEIADAVLPKRSTIWSNETTVAKDGEGTLAKYSIILVTRNARLLINSFCNLMQEDYTATHEMTEEDFKAVRDWEYKELKSHTYYTEAPIYVRAWGRDAFIAEAAALDDHFKDANGEIGYTFKNEYGRGESRKDIVAADVYYKTTVIRAELASHGFFWRLFNFRKVAACNAYIAKAENILARIGFVESEHRDRAIEVLKSTVTVPHDMDEERVRDAYERHMDALREKNTKELTVARDNLARAKELDKDPEASVYKKLEEVLEKHGIRASFEEVLKKTAMENAALLFDKQRDISSMKNSAFVCFLRTFDAMIVSAIEGGRDINVAELLKDAKKITDVALEHYFGISGIDEIKSLDKPLYMFDLDLASVMKRLDMNANGVTVADPENPGQYKKVMAIPGAIERAKEEAPAIINEWLADPGKLLPGADAPAVPEPAMEDAKQEEDDNVIEAGPISDEARELGDRMLKIDFRPSPDNIQKQINDMKLIASLLRNNNPAATESVKGVFGANRNKLMHYKKALEQGGDALKKIEAEFDTVDKLLNAKYETYKPATVKDLEARRQNISVALDEPVEDVKIEANDKQPEPAEVKNIEEEADEVQQRKKVDEIHDQMSAEDIEALKKRMEEQYEKEIIAISEGDIEDAQKMNGIMDRINEENVKEIASKTMAK